MVKHAEGGSDETDVQPAVNRRVRVYPGTEAESRGDFGGIAARPVDLGGKHFADPARRWAVALDTSERVFANTDQLVAD